jgi:hypothetical protein
MTYNNKVYTVEEITRVIEDATTAGYNVEVIINGELYQVGGKEDTKHD